MNQKLENIVERGVVTAINAVNISKPEYEEFQLPDQAEQSHEHAASSDITVLGGLLAKSGAVIAASGALMEVLPESADTVSHMAIATGLGAMAIGVVVAGYDKLTN